jgi:hypothetical protein
VTPVIYGHQELDELLAQANLHAAAATAPITAWPPVLLLMAEYWAQHTHAAICRIELASPTPNPFTSPSHWLRSGPIPGDTFPQFAADTVAVLADLVATDPLRATYFGQDEPGPKLDIQCGFEIPLAITPVPGMEVDPTAGRLVRMQTARPDNRIPAGVQALVRITLPYAISARFWPHDIATVGRDHMTSIDYRRMIQTVSDWWQSQGYPAAT